VVHHLDEYFHRKYEEDTATHTMKKVAEGEDLIRAEEEAADSDIHLPSASYWPIVLAFGVGVLCMGVIYGVPIMVLGAAIVLFASYGWVLEPSVAEPIDFEPPSADGSTKEIAPLG
jgi:cytochrome c oxidase subunit 1